MVLATITLAAQSTYFKLKQSTSKDSGIFIDSETFESISPFVYTDEDGRDAIKLIVHKDDCIRALGNIMCSLPLFTSKSGMPREITNPVSVYNELNSAIVEFFGDSETRSIDSLYFSELQNRKYLWGTEGRRADFELRKFFVANHTELSFISEGSDELHVRFDTHLVVENKEVFEPEDAPKELVEDTLDESLQIIFYGAPGTGKSHRVDKTAKEENSIRTTFHPDSDYATFVGAYKPTMREVPMSAFVGKEVHIAQPQGDHSGTEKKIVYNYVPQAFLKAYIEAWKRYGRNESYYLVIEEINRGNCAQIFGDLFQLLDRNDQGASSYAINADDDIAQFLDKDSKGFAGLSNEERVAIENFILVKDNNEQVALGDDILHGRKLLFPPNLRIWATMNTSDQSLFPIDSAFKRRWNWEYMPIEYDKKDWVIAVGDRTYSWGRFLELINPEIYGLTGSADKQMGYFFAKPDTFDKEGNRNVISEKLFINKVLFYLWTDVLKDYDLSKKPFVYEDENHKKKAFVFTDFFGKNATANLLRFFEGIEGLEPVEATEPKDDNNNDFSVTFPDGTVISEPTLTATYMQALKKISFEEVAKSKANDLKNPLVTLEKIEGLEKPRRYNEIDGWYVLVGPDTYPYYKKLELLNNELSLNLDIKHK